MAAARPMRVLQVSASDAGGGANAVAARLTAGLRQLGHESWLAVGHRTRQEPGLLAIPHDDGAVWRHSGYTAAYEGLRRVAAAHPGSGAGLASRLLRRATHPEARHAWRTGLEDFDFSGTARLLSLPPSPPDLLHAHNLHGGYFDLRQLPTLSHRLPVCLTLHDAWLLSGHCAHSFDCERWRTGCGACPDLTIEPAVRRDRTAENWRTKQGLFADARLHVATPSAWLMARVEASILAPALASVRVIPNGIDTTAFAPGDQATARAAFDLAPDTLVIMVTTGEPGARWRDTDCVVDALDRVVAQREDRPVRILAVGRAPLTAGAISPRLAARLIDTGHLGPERMRQAYHAADLYVHAARVDTFPTTVLEALACGRPVVATRTGGIPEQIRSVPLSALLAGGEAPALTGTGALLESGDAAGMSAAMIALLGAPALRRRLGAQAAADARDRFSLDRQVRACADWYCEILSARHAS